MLHSTVAGRRTRRLALSALIALSVSGSLATGPALANDTKPLRGDKAISDVDLWLTVLHFNDGESELLGDNVAGGADRFVNKMNTLVREGRNYAANSEVVVISSGDNFLAGPEFTASLDKPLPFYDSMVMFEAQTDVAVIGNHEFDFGPDVLAAFIAPQPSVTFVSANLDFSGEANLQDLVDAGRIAPSVVLTKGGEQIGVVGATTPNLPFISSPRNVAVDPDVAAVVQAEVDELVAGGVNKIIFVSHLQSVNEDLELLGQLSGIDLAIAGGGDELLANTQNPLVEGDEEEVFGPYPLYAVDADGNNVPVVTTSGQYRYVGRLVVGFDADGDIQLVDTGDSGPQRVVSNFVDSDGVSRNNRVKFLVSDPVSDSVATLDATIIGNSQVGLNGVRGDVRTMETNQGNLIADALLWQANQLAGDFGAPMADVSLQNGGGIRNDSMIPAGPLSELDTFDMVPFGNFVSLVPGIPRSQFKEIMENAVSNVENVSGRFAQVAGFNMVYDVSGTPQELDDDGNVATPGNRVREIVLDDGTVVVSGGQVQAGAEITIATIDFLARGGDQYPYRGANFTNVGVTYQQALSNYIQQSLGGTVTSGAYPEGGEGRITRLN